MIISMHTCTYVYDCEWVREGGVVMMISGWGYGEKKSDDAVQGGVGIRGWGGAVEEQGEGVRNDAVDGRLREKRKS